MTFVIGHPYGKRFKKGENLGENHPMWKGGKPKCLTCNKQLSARRIRGKDIKYCHKHKVKYGSEHQNWVNGNYKKAERKDKSSAYMYWMRAVKNRDGWKCQIKNEDCSGRLESHHILNWEDYPKLRYELNNGITLCVAHHPRGRAKEKRMVSTFMELLSVSKEQF